MILQKLKRGASAMMSAILFTLPEPVRAAFLRKAVTVASERTKFKNGQLTMFGSIANLSLAGFAPTQIIDIGANVGDWTAEVSKIFPQSHLVMIEAQPSLAEHLHSVSRSLGDRASFVSALLGAEASQAVRFHLLGTGSSVLEEVTGFPKEAVDLPMVRLDDVIKLDAHSRIFLKLDVQGYELPVLAGASEVLKKTDVVLMEVALLEYNSGAPLMNEVFSVMAGYGFVPYDFCSQLRRHSDGALFQTDVIFVRSESSLRQKRKFWAHEP